MNKVYRFKEQLKKSEEWENILDDYFSSTFEITPASDEEQRRGIDRHYLRRQTGWEYLIEYKIDFMGHRTGNFFIETISVDTAGKPGWAATSEADYFFFYTVENSTLYSVITSLLRNNLERLTSLYPHAEVPNDGYKTHGILVPILEIAKISKPVVIQTRKAA